MSWLYLQELKMKKLHKALKVAYVSMEIAVLIQSMYEDVMFLLEMNQSPHSEPWLHCLSHLLSYFICSLV